MKKAIFGLMISLGFACAAPVSGEPLEPGHVASDAKWVMHVNFDAFRETTLARHLRETVYKKPQSQKYFEWVRDRYGIDLREDLHGLTLYGVDFKPHQGVAVLLADYDREKVLDVIQDEPGYKSSEHGDYTLHTWAMHHHKMHGKHGDCKQGKCKKDDKCEKSKRKKCAKHEHHNDKDGHHKDSHSKDGKDKHGDKHGRHNDKDHGDHHDKMKSITAAFHEDAIVMAGNAEGVKRALAVLDDRKKGLDEQSGLLTEAPEGTVFYGAATDLDELKGRDYGKFAWKFAILQQGERIDVALGENDKQAFEHVHFEANEDVAEQMGKIVDGFKAMVQLHAQAKEKETLFKVIDGLSSKVDGGQIAIKWEANADDVLKVLQHKMKQWKAKRHGDSAKEHSKHERDKDGRHEKRKDKSK